MWIKKIAGKIVTPLIVCIMLNFLSCIKTPPPEPYSDPYDFTTTNIKTNIIQIETGESGFTWVKAYISVTNQEGTPLENFNVANFEVTEGTIPVELGEITFNSFEGGGGSIATPLIMDYSGSMSGQPIVDMETAVKSFISKMQAQDIAEIIKFSSWVEVSQSFTSNKDLLTLAVDSSWSGAGYSTALCDAIYTGITDASQQTGLKATLAFTDGYENCSSHTWSDVIQHALNSKLAIYTIGLGECDSSHLKLVADTTGGRYFYAPTSQDLQNIYQLISGQLQKSYTLKWNVKSQSGSQVTIIIRVTYECGNGTFESISTGSFVAP